ncbi:PAS domain-containing protein [Flavobacterium luminosum]|uniref:PAS domain-containing protein n=1 Tax=Flavobacterium luminosum TaxID=2949086 RepID=A0ABT0TP70_9FLAO|nr:PAS domain-containing protein [Flavobacterium sp. HXWNR70]MCL9809282.1 PAS domain-containing protein [Flavobacterium sp. HXWNR70]
MEKPIPVDEAVVWDTSLTIVSKTDLFGTIEYINDVFAEVSGYTEPELVGQPHNIIRHPDMPKVIFKTMWDHIKKGYKFHGIIKNLAKSGKHYWVITDFDYIVDDNAKIQKYIARRKAISDDVVKKIEALYKKLSDIEAVSGIEASEKYLVGYLEDINLSYVDMITKLMLDDAKSKDFETATSDVEKENVKKGFFSKFFGHN